jgi:putative FmdB family regulatory protein
MPTYEYRCMSCGNRFDVFQRLEDEALRVCERCGGELRKVFHPAGIVFKGSGFYATDSRKKKASGDGAGDKKGEPSTTTTKPTKEKSAGSTSGGEGSSS